MKSRSKHVTQLDSRGPVVEVSRLSKTYPGDVEAVKEIDFQIAAREVFGLLGPNGAGKSTTIAVGMRREYTG